MKVFGLLKSAIFLALVCEGYSAPCNVTAAQACVDSQTTPADNSQCTTALSTLYTTVTCVQTNTEECTAGTGDAVTQSLTQIQSTISTTCGGTCTDLGTKWAPYQECLSGRDLTQLVSNISTVFNTNYVILSGEIPACGELRTISSCLRVASRSCDYLRSEFANLYKAHVTLKQVQDLCGIESAPTASQGPIIAECPNLEAKLAEIKTNCPFTFDYESDGNNTLIHACGAMQQQIDCVLAYQSECPQAVTQFLKPRLEAYTIPNTIFCDNMTMNGVRIRTILLPGVTCSNDNVYSCFFSLMRTFGAEFNRVNQPSLLQFLQWNVFDEAEDTRICQAFIGYNVTSTALCLDQSLQYCPIPFPTFGGLSTLLGNVAEYNPVVYDLLVSGPVPLNKYGARFIGDRRSFICYEECEQVDELSTALSTTCGPDVLDKAERVVNNAIVTTQCSVFAAAIPCAANSSISCPLLYHDVLDIFQDSDVMAALEKCNLPQPALLPEDYNRIITEAPPATTSFTWRTTIYSTLEGGANTTNTTDPPNPSTASPTGQISAVILLAVATVTRVIV